jgi:hypothetical protein
VAAQEHPIDICNVCHVSYYVNEMREEYVPDTSGLSPTGYVLQLTCVDCDGKILDPAPVRHLRLVKS